MLPAERAASCQQFCSTSNINWSSAGIFAILVATTKVTAELKSAPAICLLRLRVKTSPPRAASKTSGAELEVETCLHDVDIGRDADAVGHKTARPSWQADQPVWSGRAKAIVIIFDEAGEPIQKGIFGANPDRPTTLRRAVGGDVNSVNLESVAAVEPSATSLHVSEPTVPRIADTCSDRCQRVVLCRIGQPHHGATDEGRNDRIGSVAVGVGPIIVSLDTEYPGTYLIIATKLRPAEYAACGAAAKPVEFRVAPRVVRP